MMTRHDEPGLDELTARMRRLERANRRWTLIAAAGIAAGVAGSGPRPASPDPVPATLTARAIRMVDAHGRIRAELAIDDDGSAGLFLRDPEGRVRSAHVHDDRQTGQFIMNDAGDVRVGTALFAHGGGGFALHGDEGKGGAVLYLKDRRGALTFYDEEGTVLERIPSRPPQKEEAP